jgi:hypothetical protein
LPLAVQPIAEGFALNVRHGIPEAGPSSRAAGQSSAIEHRQNQGMMESGGDPDLPFESGSAEGDRELGAEHLECDMAVVPQVPREVDRGHAAAAQLTLDRVAVAKGVSQ